MKTVTNYTAGLRGVNLKDKPTHWVEPGASFEFDPKDVEGGLPDFGKAPATDEDADLIASIEAENADLKKQVADQAKEIEALKKAAKAT
jgi:hypothetical protein